MLTVVFVPVLGQTSAPSKKKMTQNVLEAAKKYFQVVKCC